MSVCLQEPKLHNSAAADMMHTLLRAYREHVAIRVSIDNTEHTQFHARRRHTFPCLQNTQTLHN